MGHPEMAFHEQWVTAEYDWLYLEKFDYYRQEIDDYWDEILKDYEEQNETEAIFRDGLGLFFRSATFHRCHLILPHRPISASFVPKYLLFHALES